jgi:hypothetical protein
MDVEYEKIILGRNNNTSFGHDKWCDQVSLKDKFLNYMISMLNKTFCFFYETKKLASLL